MMQLDKPRPNTCECAAAREGGPLAPAPRPVTPKTIWAFAAGLAVSILTVGLVWGGGKTSDHTAPPAKPFAAEPSRPVYPVVIRQPQGAALIATGLTNFLGQPAMASCGSCHTTTKPNAQTRATADLDQFHQGLKYTHGNLTCLSCHNAGDYEELRLADGRGIEFQQSIDLCSQCHGPQRRDYDRGLHGGMNGHWDLTRGGRTRNTCINCHDPHSPAFPQVMPVLAPRDRISVRAQQAGSHAASAEWQNPAATPSAAHP